MKYAAFALALAACATLTPLQVTRIGVDQTAIAHCQAAGFACKYDGGIDCYDTAYGACMRDAGLWNDR